MEQKKLNGFGREFEEYQRSTYTERLREQLARRVEELMEPLAPVVFCVSRANGKTEFLRRGGVYRDLRTNELVDLEAQGEELRKLHELMEPVVQSMVEQAWQKEALTPKTLTPKTLGRIVREMEKVRILDTVRAAMEDPYLMPQMLEEPFYELDLEKTCPWCGGVMRAGAGGCNRCFFRGCARSGGRW